MANLKKASDAPLNSINSLGSFVAGTRRLTVLNYPTGGSDTHGFWNDKCRSECGRQQSCRLDEAAHADVLFGLEVSLPGRPSNYKYMRLRDGCLFTEG